MRCILVPLDGSAFAESALPYAIDVARRTGARVRVLSVHVPMPPLRQDERAFGESRGVDAEERAALQHYLDDVTRRIASVADAPAVEGMVLEGPPAATIASHAAHCGADLVALTSHGRGGLSRYWIGSVADHLIRRLRMPVLVVRPLAGPPATLPVVALRRVLVTIDETPESHRAIESAVAVAGADGVQYTLLNVVRPLTRVVQLVTTAEEIERDAVTERRRAEALLAGLEGQLCARGMHVRSVVRLHLHPAEEIVAFAEEVGTDMIALATHGRGALERILIGSVGDKVLRSAPVPVLLHNVSAPAG